MTDPAQKRRRGGQLRGALLASLLLHGALVMGLRHVPVEPPVDEPLAIELMEEAVPVPPPVVTPPAPPDPALAPAPAAPPRVARPTPHAPAPAVAAGRPAQVPTPAPAPPPPAEGLAWMKLRSPAEALARGAVPRDLTPPAGPARDALGLPTHPLPNVIHHPTPLTGPPGTTGRHQAESGVSAKVGSDGALSFNDPGAVEDVHAGASPMGLSINGKFDLNDTVARALGDDPYAYAKKKFAEATFEDRLCLAEKAAMARKQDALFALKARLEALRTEAGLGPAQQRELVFEMWDECLDSGQDGPDLGAAARATILAFIRRAFPPGGPQAYAVNELAALNRRRTSRALFDPYGDAALPRADAGTP